MPHTIAARAPAARAACAAALAAAALAATAVSARAQPATLTFDALTAVDGSGVRYVNNCYEEGGYRVTLAGLACGADGALATWTPDNDLYYTGSPALYNNLGPSVDITAVDGRRFALRSIGLAPLLGQLGNPTTVLFTGFLSGGGTVTRTIDVAGGVFGTPTAPTAYSLVGLSGLTRLRLTVTAPEFEPNVQFDNVALAAIPEPGTVALLGVGLAALGLRARRRR